MGRFPSFLLFMSFLAALFTAAYVADDVALIRANSARELMLLQSERDTMDRHFRSQVLRDHWSHQIELRNLDASIRRLESDREAELREQKALRNSKLTAER